jgi:(E)-4-hydroxy-3-methylbut-2-enyl-diphosphate synthase
MGSNHPIRVQSMTTTNTMDTNGTVEQSIRMIEAGCELVRITAPSIKEAQNLLAIKSALRERGYTTPLVADIHYTPNAAEIAARIVEKVRINPGNYVDKKFFQVLEYSESEYQQELDRIRQKFVPLLTICKEHGTALRIGTNHGSLSDRITSRYGDSPTGMVESALEFLQIAHAEGFHNIVLSMKSSNPRVMVQAYRLLVAELHARSLPPYPLHLGVTEAGDGLDGRTKSAVGIGTLLEDGLGDTIRVSLTEEPEAEIPVAMELARRYSFTANTGSEMWQTEATSWNPYEYHKRTTTAVATFGGVFPPRVVAPLSVDPDFPKEGLSTFGHHYDAVTDKWTMGDQAAEYFLCNDILPFMPPAGTRQIVPYATWLQHERSLFIVPFFTIEEFLLHEKSETVTHSVINIVRCDAHDLFHAATCQALAQSKVPLVLFVSSRGLFPYNEWRNVAWQLQEQQSMAPVVWEDQQRNNIYSATDIGGVLLEGYGDGIVTSDMQLGFGILQAARTRMTKTEYISCPSCGRTLFDLQETTANIRERTDHLKGIKIGIMGCIVNGPGEMADADYGYVGSGPDKITLYRGQSIVKRNVPTADAVDELIEIIKADDRWVQPTGK